MPRPRKPDKKRWMKPGVDGYVSSVEGRAYSFYGTTRKALGFAFHETNRQACLVAHEERVRAIKLRRLGVRDDVRVIDMRTITELVAHFTDVRLAEATINTQEEYERAINHYLIGCRAPLSEPEEITRWMSKRNTAPSPRFKHGPPRPLAQSTRFNYLTKIRAIFAYGVTIGWIARNPVDIMGLPSRKGGSHERVPWSVAERAIELMRSRHPVAARCCALILATGMRSHEARMMRLDQFHDDHIEIIGKGAARMPNEDPEDHRRRKPRRLIPLVHLETMAEGPLKVWQSALQAIARECTEQTAPNPKGYVFWMNDAKVGAPRPLSLGVLQWQWWRACEEVTRSDGAERRYTIHGLRKTAEDYFENTLHLDPWDFCDMTGHSVTTYIQSYRKRRTARDVVESLHYHAELDRITARLGGLPNDPAKHLLSIDREHPNTGPTKPRRTGKTG